MQTARAVAARFPAVDIRIVTGEREPEGRNPKVRSLARMARVAKYPLLVAADSDIRVGTGYLQALAAAFTAPDVGAATCLYGGVPAGGLFAELGAMHVNEYFAPSVLVAAMLAPLQYCFGATLAVRTSALEQIGGFDALAGELGDDYALGKAIASSGYRVALCPYVVTTTISERSFAELWAREVRWARTIRSVRPAGYAGSVMTYALTLASAAALLRPSRTTGAALGTAAAFRFAIDSLSRRTLAPQAPAAPWLIPVRDLLEVAVWCAGLCGGRVRWREADYAITSRGRIQSSKEATSATSSP